MEEWFQCGRLVPVWKTGSSVEDWFQCGRVVPVWKTPETPEDIGYPRTSLDAKSEVVETGAGFIYKLLDVVYKAICC